jgi:hypothetical protein
MLMIRIANLGRIELAVGNDFLNSVQPPHCLRHSTPVQRLRFAARRSNSPCGSTPVVERAPPYTPAAKRPNHRTLRQAHNGSGLQWWDRYRILRSAVSLWESMTFIEVNSKNTKQYR